MKYILRITPAIGVSNRHRIERLLVKLGYDVIGGGQMVNGAECDISFETKESSEKKPKCKKCGGGLMSWRKDELVSGLCKYCLYE